MRKYLIIIVALISLSAMAPSDWGFFGHRRINRMAVFTLPPEMIVFYKKNIEYVTEHAVDPDKRRYATKHEEHRHYIDIDHWGTFPFDNVPRDWTDALLKYATIHIVKAKEDTVELKFTQVLTEVEQIKNKKMLAYRDALSPGVLKDYQKKYKRFFRTHIMPLYYEDEWLLDPDTLNAFLQSIDQPKVRCESAFALDHFTEYGIIPYHLVKMQQRLTEAFRDENEELILRLSADFGHYIGDAHVPLHTTTNYNGQLTDQVGIHGFWESRIPELFADDTYDYFVGKAEYIDDPSEYYWDVVLTSHTYVDSLLAIEKNLSRTFPSDKQFCFDNRLDYTVRTQCKAYAAEYQRLLMGQVEDRMRASILAVGSAWYTAWIDGGQPDLSKMESFKMSEEERKEMEAQFKSGEIKGRSHGF